MEGNEGLSPEELAAMEGEDETQTDDLLAQVAGEKEEEETPVVEVPAAAAPAAPAAAMPDAPTPAAAAVEEGLLAGVNMADAPTVAMFTPQYSEDLRPDLQQKLDAARERYEAGEEDMDLAAYEKVQRQVNAENLTWQTHSARWNAEQAAFFGKFKEFAGQGPLRDALDGEIRRLDATAEGQNLSGMELLMAARAKVSAAFGLGSPKAEPRKEPAARPASARPAAATHALGELPAAAVPEVGGGEFAHLETLSGLDLERAVAALSPEQRERWAAEN